jgi:kinesin family member C2/C3
MISQTETLVSLLLLEWQRLKEIAVFLALQRESDCCDRLKQQYGLLLREKEECRRLLEDLLRENEVKTIECRQAQESLHHMKMELMRKSMNVGTLGTTL